MSSSKEQIEKKFQLSKSRKSETVTPMKSLPPVKRSCVNNINKSVVYQNKSFDAKESYMVNKSYDNINMSEEKVTNIKAMKKNFLFFMLGSCMPSVAPIVIQSTAIEMETKMMLIQSIGVYYNNFLFFLVLKVKDKSLFFKGGSLLFVYN